MALSGDGGDELFAGYTRHRFARALAGVPASVGSFLACGLGVAGPALWDRAFGLLPARRRPTLAGDKMLKAASMLREGGEGAYRSLVSAWDQPEAIARLGRELKGAIFDPAVAAALPDGLDRMQYLDTLTYLPDDILTKVDRASMAVALEVRVPILDHRIVELSWRLPSRFKMRRGKGKWLLRQVLYRHVPPDLVERPKSGFAIPIGSWLQGPAQALGRGAPVGEAACRGWAARPGADPRALARASCRQAQLACAAVDRADVSGLAAAARDLSSSARAGGAQLAEGHDIVLARRLDGRLAGAVGGGHPIGLDALGERPRPFDE